MYSHPIPLATLFSPRPHFLQQRCFRNKGVDVISDKHSDEGGPSQRFKHLYNDFLGLPLADILVSLFSRNKQREQLKPFA